MNKKVLQLFVSTGIIALVIAPLCLLYLDTKILFPFITGKNFFWRFFVEIAVLMWASAALLSPNYRISWKKPFVLSLIVFMSVILIANTFGHSPYYAFWSGAERMDGYISLLHLAGYFIALVGLLKTKENMQRMLMFLLGIGVLLAFFGWTQDKERIDSKLGNPIYLASLSFFGIFISGYFLVVKEKIFNTPHKTKIILCSLLILGFIYTMFRTGTRGALLGLVGGGFTTAFIVAVCSKNPADKIWKYLAGALVVLTLIASGIFFGAREQLSQLEFVQEDILLSRLVRISPEDRTTGFRLANWNMAIEGWKERPLLGWGQEGYTEVFSKYYDDQKLYNAEQWYDRVHNTFLDWLVFGGILGLISYVALFIAILYLLWKRSSFSFLERSVLTGLFVGYLFQNIVAFDSLVSGIFLYACFAFVVSASQERKTEKENLDTDRTFTYLSIGLLVIGTIFWMYYSIYIPRESAKNYIDYLIVTSTNGPLSVEKVTDALPYFEKIFTHETFLTRELVIQGIQQRARYFVPGVNNETLSRYIEPISINTISSLQKFNSPTKLSLIYGTYLIDLRIYDQALEQVNTALAQSPNKPAILWTKAALLERTGDIQGAETIYKIVINNLPQFKEAQERYSGFIERTKQ